MKRFFAVAALGLTLAGCSNPNSSNPGGNGPSSGPGGSPPTVTQTPPSGSSGAAPGQLVVYVLNPKATGEEDLLIAHPISARHPHTPVQDALTGLLEASHSPIAPGTALRGVSVDGGTATLDFSRSPVNQTGGEGGQSVALNALAMTLGQFPDITAYQIQVQGRPVTQFGEFTADGPMAVIRPGEKVGEEPKPEGSSQ